MEHIEEERVADRMNSEPAIFKGVLLPNYSLLHLLPQCFGYLPVY